MAGNEPGDLWRAVCISCSSDLMIRWEEQTKRESTKTCGYILDQIIPRLIFGNEHLN